jgi:prepilin-type N-terminal cleavage/methylation domain-containing protein/prepilin-type processing-associated H-X9-DG protein
MPDALFDSLQQTPTATTLFLFLTVLLASYSPSGLPLQAEKMKPVLKNALDGQSARCRRAFSLIELLIVMMIAGVLVSMLLPAINRARSQARLIQCKSNERQLCVALIAYASENKGKFPPNVSSPDPGQYWSDVDRLGQLCNVNALTEQNGQMIGPLFTCPEDIGSVRTYAMNIWASSKVDLFVQNATKLGSLWSYNVARPTNMILIAETWSYFVETSDSFRCAPTFGYVGMTVGQRFGGAGGISPTINAGRWGQVNCELAYMLHRAPGSAGRSTQPIGLVNLGYADGHVETKSNVDLVNSATGISTNDSFFSPLDFANQ